MTVSSTVFLLCTHPAVVNALWVLISVPERITWQRQGGAQGPELSNKLLSRTAESVYLLQWLTKQVARNHQRHSFETQAQLALCCS